MELKYVKNIQFTRLIKVDGQLKEFNFRKSNGRQEGLFSIDVIDSKGNRIIFNMEMKDGVWKITNEQLPAWVMESELSFHEIIEEEFKSV
ncbi:MAG: hypothetical protein IPG38_12660 [Chitinophagaceae bacterium]|nr:hypothetical protein [Chitinophagaceae bacterium]